VIDNRCVLMLALAREVQVQGATWRPTARGEGQVKGSRENASRLGPRDSERPGGVTGDSHGARTGKEAWMETASVKSGEARRRPDTRRHRRGRVAATRGWTV